MSKFSAKSYGVGAVLAVGVLTVFVKLALAIAPFTPALAPTGYVAQDEITNYNVSTGNETVFRTDYEKGFYSGNLYAYPIDDLGNLSLGADRWSGGVKVHIDAQNYNTGRKIATMKDDGTPIPFRWSSALSSTQQGYLTSETILNYLRGDRSEEIPRTGKTLRERASALGDIVHSRPIYVADASNPTIFVGANDGMLHAINAAAGSGGGDERWAYVPSMLLNKMKNLSVHPYARDYFVDGQIAVSKVTSGASQKRILVGGLGGGGKGLYALDISTLTADSEADVANKVMWEITPSKVNYNNPTTSNAYINLGYTYGKPTIVKVGGADRIIIGNGYNDNANGDYQAYLYLINPLTGQRVAAIQAGTSGSATSPNGLSTPVAVDRDGDDSADFVFAGDLNGTMWKFDLSSSTASALYTTSPAQPITATPGVAIHPNGGYMVNFATGALFTAANASDTSVYYAYGIWDIPSGNPASVNAALLTQTLTERVFPGGIPHDRVRRVTSNQAVWTAGAANHKGWKVALPAGERVVGEGSFVENGRFYFTSTNPTLSTTTAITTTTPATEITTHGENWLMELNSFTGGAINQPFFDMNKNNKIDAGDRLKYVSGDTLPITTPPTVVGDLIMTTDGVVVGKFLSTGVTSQPIYTQNSVMNETLFNTNQDQIPLATILVETGITGGHFDADIFYGAATAATQARATITVASTGPATLGGIALDGVTVVPALGTADIKSGDSINTIAATIMSKMTLPTGFSVTRSNNVLTITAPAGASYNGKTLTIVPGTSSAGSPAVVGVRPTGRITFSGTTTSSTTVASINNDVGGSSVKVGAISAWSSAISISTNRSPSQVASRVVSVIGTSGSIQAYVGGNNITPTCAASPTNVVCLVNTQTYDPASLSVSIGSRLNFGGVSASTTATTGGTTPAVVVAGWSDFSTALSTAAFSGGSDVGSGDSCTQCDTKLHVHQYDDKYDVTGLNMLNPSETRMKLSNVITDTSAQFKVLVMNQYLNPAMKLHIGQATYLYNVDAGYIKIKDYLPITGETLDLSTVPTYTLANIGSLVVNMSPDSLTARNWWGNGDVRTGLHPVGNYRCPISSATSSNDGNQFRPIIPPVNGVEGPGTQAWSGSSTPATARGARHNGALTIQIITASTPSTSVVQNVANRSEYGWTVRSQDYASYVLAEYVFFWHTPDLRTTPPSQNTGPCYGDAGWTKAPLLDASSSATVTKALNSTDPKIGDLSAGGSGTITSTVTTVSGNVQTTVITYDSGRRATIVRTTNANGTVTIVTTDAAGNVTTQTIAKPPDPGAAVIRGGFEGNLRGDLRDGSLARTGRISWHELVSP